MADSPEARKPYRVLHPVRYEGELKTSGTIFLSESEAAPALARGIVEETNGAAASGSPDTGRGEISGAEAGLSGLDPEMIRLFGEGLASDLYQGGYESVEQVRSASEEELLAVKDVGKKRVTQIRRASDNPSQTS